jgi:hypothetical protein
MLWYAAPNAISNAIGYAKFRSRSHDAVIRVYESSWQNDTNARADGRVDRVINLLALVGAELVARFMNYRRLIFAVALIAVRLVIPFASAAPKAYDTVSYKGKAAGLKIVFEFDTGYVEASTVKITESASGNTTRFRLSGREMGTGKIRFAPVKGAKKEVLLEMDPFGAPLSTVKGSYTAAGKTVPFTLTKRKKH